MYTLSVPLPVHPPARSTGPLNTVFALILLLAFGSAAATGAMHELSAAALSAAKLSVELAIGLVGYMALFLGLMQIASDSGLLRVLARAVRPIMVRLFPDIPADHPAMSAMVMNIGANMLGLGNAATPLGIKAMQELDRLNRHPGVATNAMVLFLALNTSSLSLVPTKIIALRQEAGSADAVGVVASTLFATLMSTIVAVIATKLLQRLRVWRLPAPPAADAPQPATVTEESVGLSASPRPPPMVDSTTAAAPDPHPVSVASVVALSGFLLLGAATMVVPALAAIVLPADDPSRAAWIDFSRDASDWVIPVLIAAITAFGWRRGVHVYESFVTGAREGFETGVRIIPYLVAILVAVGMFRASGAMGLLTSALGGITGPLGLPAEALPMALVRPLSGSGAFGVMTELMTTHGPDSYIGYLVSTLMGSTETTFYVLAVYFGAVSIGRTRHALAAGLCADLAGVVGAVIVCRALFGHLAG